MRAQQIDDRREVRPHIGIPPLAFNQLQIDSNQTTKLGFACYWNTTLARMNDPPAERYGQSHERAPVNCVRGMKHSPHGVIMWSQPNNLPGRDKESSLTSQAYTAIRDRIVTGSIALGEGVSRRQLAAELGIGSLPVASALLLLQFEGLVESRSRAGTRVRIPTHADIEGHYLVREALEIQAARVFARVASPSERNALRKLARRVDALSGRPDPMPYMFQHQRLHRRIAEGTRSRALCDAIEKTHAFACIWLGALRRASNDDRTRHQEFVERIITGSEMAITRAVREHLEVSKARVLQILQPYFANDKRKASSRTYIRTVRAARSA
jgi:DNA-binding GntR family transcriptional regulator